jgi:glyoxylase-like metal-dependent hydrolase (beta-lactamase superfamily II)
MLALAPDIGPITIRRVQTKESAMPPYDGQVTPGGPPQVRELPHLMITKVSVGPMDNNAYLLRCRATDEQLLIDAAADAPRLLRLVGPEGLTAVVTTHRHGDHVGALVDVATATGARTYAHAADADDLPVPPTVRVHDGDVITFGKVSIEAIHLAGHTPGGLALAYDDPEGHAHLFTGDSLFPGGVGNTWGDPEAFAHLLSDVSSKLFARWPDEAWVYPGHGRDTTLGAERPDLASWAERGW